MHLICFPVSLLIFHWKKGFAFDQKEVNVQFDLFYCLAFDLSLEERVRI